MSIFVTGATGFIGSKLVKELLHRNLFGNVVILVRDIDKAKSVFGKDFDSLTVIVGDVRDRLCFDGTVDYIVHGASVTKSQYMLDNPEETKSIIVDGTKNIIDFAKSHNTSRMVLLSSMEVYGQVDEKDYLVTEDELGYLDSNNPRNCYPLGKREAETLCKSACDSHFIAVIARLALTLGPGIPKDDNRIAMQFAKSVIENKDIVLHTSGNSMSNFCYIDDAVNGILTILEKGIAGEAYNVCNDVETRSIKEIASLIANDIAYGNIKVVYDISSDAARKYATDTRLKLSSTKLKALGWKPTISLVDAYKRLVDYLKLTTMDGNTECRDE